mmetsp:Transcript_39699/g.94244  ORF Transcript_39699/g.94244 Transcript_39699/m.94244 type:complete len:233 (+) Transcript_39699:140-838(+)
MRQRGTLWAGGRADRVQRRASYPRGDPQADEGRRVPFRQWTFRRRGQGSRPLHPAAAEGVGARLAGRCDANGSEGQPPRGVPAWVCLGSGRGMALSPCPRSHACLTPTPRLHPHADALPTPNLGSVPRSSGMLHGSDRPRQAGMLKLIGPTQARGKWMGAEAMFRQAADICAAQLGRTHGLTVSVLLHLLGAQMQLGSSEGMERAAALSKALLPAAKEAWCAATEPPASGQA